MSHDLEFNADGMANMAWTNETPWHGLGVQMDPDATPEEWMKAANLDWTIRVEDTYLADGRTAPARVIVRESDDMIFGAAGPKWVEVQNHEAFDFLKKFTDAGDMKMETCGALKDGTEIWALARISEDFEPVKGDVSKSYLLFHLAHIWGKGNSLRLTPVRVVCNNTLQMALRSGGSKGHFSMPHIRAFDADVQRAATEALGLADQELQRYQEQVAFLASKKCEEDELAEFIARIYQPNLLKDREATGSETPLYLDFNPSAENVWQAVAMAPGADLNGSKGTWWGAVNGVTYMEDHMRLSYTDQTKTLSSLLVGGGSRRKSVAFELALDYAQAA